MLQALTGIAAVTVLTENPIDLDRLNRFLGTTLCSTNLRIHCLPLPIRRLLRLDPDPDGFQGTALLQRLGGCGGRSMTWSFLAPMSST